MAEVRLCLVAFVLAAFVPGGLSTCKEASCPRNETCCTSAEGGEACCPYSDGICCLDSAHCCPFGTICDVDDRRCIFVGSEVDRQTSFLEIAAAPNVSSASSNEHCPDGSTCPDVSTCCMMTTKQYGCCPFQDAVCCRDYAHCCPSGTHCIGGGLCYRPPSENDIEGAEAPHAKQAVIAQARRGGVSACTDTTCPEDKTCCELAGGGEGCCPYRNAICCSDGIHCCPSGTICDVEGGRCLTVTDEKKERVAFVELITTTTSNISVSNEHCPDGSTCPGVSTCCMTTTKHYGCCPFQQGVCCRDMIHCCPHGTHCYAGGMCRRQQSESDVVAARVQEHEQVVATGGCSGGQQRCGRDQTCCDKVDGSAGCCPMKNAVCCDGLDSCCPEGLVCSPFGCRKV